MLSCAPGESPSITKGLVPGLATVSSFPDSFARNACMRFFLHLCVLDLPSPLSVSFRQMKKLRLREGKPLSWLQSYILELYVSGSPVS